MKAPSVSVMSGSYGSLIQGAGGAGPAAPLLPLLVIVYVSAPVVYT